MSSSMTAFLATAQQITIRYIESSVFVLGVIGSLLNLILFSRRQLRMNSCCSYFFTSSLAALVLLSMGIIPLIYAQFYSPNPYFSINGFCKIRAYVNQVSAMSCRWLLTMASIDRCAACTTNVNIRRLCSVKIARRIAIVLVIIWMILPIHTLIFFNILPPSNIACRITNNDMAMYHAIYTIVMGGTLPVLIMLICTVFIWRNLKKKNQRRAVINVVQVTRRTDKRDQQIVVILLAQVTIFVVSTIPFMANNLYSAVTRSVPNKSADRIAIESFLQVITELFVYIFPAVSFYSNTLVSRTFRKELIKMTEWFRLFHGRKQRHIHPNTQTRTNEILLNTMNNLLLLLASAIIGAIFGFFKSKKNSAKEFLLADGGMRVFPTALSIMVSFISAITFLGTPVEVYMYGTMFWYQAAAWSTASLIAAFVFMPKFREMYFTSAYEKRFDRTVRISASMVFSVYMLVFMALVLYAPALALSQTTGLNIWLSVISIGGGMKAVIWTDVLQAAIMFVGILSAIIQGLIEVGGFKNVFTIASRGNRFEFNNVSFDPRTRHTIWTFFLGSTLNTLSIYGFNQTQIQRYMCVRTTRGAQQALIINAIGVASIIFLTGFMGIILYAFYVNCDPYTAKLVSGSDQIFPYFVMEVLSSKKGLPGIFLACIFSGSLSSISSGLNSLAAVLIEDVYKGLLGRQLTDERQGYVAKICSVLLGAVVMLLTYVVSYLGSLINAALSLSGILSAPIMGVFLLGFFFPRANRRGALIGFFTGLSFVMWIFIGAQLTKNQRINLQLPLSVEGCKHLNVTTQMLFNTTIPTSSNPLLGLYSVSYLWYTLISVSTVLIVGLIVSYLTGPLKPYEVDPRLLIRVSDVFGCKCFRSNVTYDFHQKDKGNNIVQSTVDLPTSKRTSLNLVESQTVDEKHNDLWTITS
ncbi:hypothetical protein I4U23_012306 [Adineta vaga]|nr:hypothetical protein I4U23_012306 [Adineta vaga]